MMPAARKGPAAADRERIAGLLASIGIDERHVVRPQPASIRSFPGTGNRAYRVRHAGLDLVARLPGADLAALVDRNAERANHAARPRPAWRLACTMSIPRTARWSWIMSRAAPSRS